MNLKQAAIDNLWMAYSGADTLAIKGGPLIIERGEGIYVYDTDGRRYIDGIAALEACAVGHGRKEIREAIYTQMESLEFADIFRVTTPPTIRLAQRLATLAPGDLSRVHFVSGGSEADEAALKLARQYHLIRGDKKKAKIISRSGAYHGCTYGVMAIDGRYYRTQTQDFEPLSPTGRFVRSSTSAEEVRELILAEGPETIAAIILDPGATSMGVHIPPPDYLPAIREMCDKYDILLIADEAITGFGRTGRMFACDHYDVVPDILTVSKGLSSGYLPIGAMIATERVASVFTGHTFSHGHTFGGHPVACAAALANLDIIENEELVANAAKMGAYLLDGLKSLDHHPSFRDVRGLGLLCGLELEDSSEAGTAFCQRVLARFRDNGLLTFTLHPGNVIFFCPPLIITAEQIDTLIDIVSRSIKQAEYGI